MFDLPTEINVATVTGSSHDTVCDLIDLFAESLKIPVTIHTVKSAKEAREIAFNRLLLLGGTDIDPALYGQKMGGAHGISKWRDEVEIELLKRAMADEIPTMGICRGHQMIAAAHGGTLWQDFPRQTRTDHGFTHRLAYIGEPLAKFLPCDTVNSLHHQAVKDVPPGFEVVAQAGDGIIEGIYRDGVLGIQSHPEMMIENEAAWTPLFCWFLIDGLRADV